MRFTVLGYGKIDGGKLNSARSVGPNGGVGISLVPLKFYDSQILLDLASAVR